MANTKEAWLLLCCNYELWNGQSSTIILIKTSDPDDYPLKCIQCTQGTVEHVLGRIIDTPTCPQIHSSNLVWCFHILPSFWVMFDSD